MILVDANGEGPCVRPRKARAIRKRVKDMEQLSQTTEEFFSFVAFLAALFGLVVALLGLQTLLAERLGVQFDGTGISFPRRAFQGRRFPALWRRRVSLGSIEKVRSKGERKLRLYLKSAEQVDVRFADRSQKLRFLNMINPDPTWNAEVRPAID